MKTALLALAFTTAWSTVAFADEPVVSTTRMVDNSATGTGPTDLPAPETTSWVNRPLLVTGTVLLAGSYVPSAIVAYTSDRPADQTNLYYPVVGPWLDLADRNCNARPCSNAALDDVLLIADGIGQGLGALGVVTSFFLPDHTTRHWYLIGDDHVHGGPSRVAGGYGFTAMGSF